MSKVIIGIHGLRNKPAKELLREWWFASIEEGFKVVNKPVPKFEFEMAYWAHYLHPEHQDHALTDRGHPLFLSEQYEPGATFGPRDPGPLRKRFISELRKQILMITVGGPGFGKNLLISDIILQTMFEELDVYYHEYLKDSDGARRPAKDLIRGELAELLRKHQGRDIMLVAHSMGAIIAYDVLIHTVPHIPIHTMITLGAPLAFPLVLDKITSEQGIERGPDEKMPTPESIQRRWYNFSDLEDVTALNYNLRKVYAENSYHIKPFDQIVYNNYESEGILNPHKSYGYLRTADFTHAVEEFLADRPITLR
ncbi:hypothetical protein ACFL5V_09555 [Fibrobacterota bacterium]